MIAFPAADACIVVTGGAGFIGSNFVRRTLPSHPGLSIINLDLLTYAGSLENLVDVETRHGPKGDGRYMFVRGNIRDFELVSALLAGKPETEKGKRLNRPTMQPSALVHFAAESHVDRSIFGPAAFIDTNVQGTFALLEACRTELAQRPREFRFIHVSTDEVYGALGPDDAPFTESSQLAPSSPYAASKAGADHLAHAWARTFDLPVIITRCSNNYGPYQFPEKLIPLMVTRALADLPLPIYGDGEHVRDWIHVDDHVDAIWTAVERGTVGRVYNIGGETEVSNIEILRRILQLLDKPHSLIRHVADRLGHDRRYAIDVSRMRSELGWSPRRTLEEGLAATVRWYAGNREWWENSVSAELRRHQTGSGGRAT